ncbi:LacI family DNA-binding transcriptional regulator [Paenibacillus sp. LPE1-1-1.1]|uniref:LacI family DNA-binding transcriptional regulator n=1 Tax=Paenibacillus sp. LPE1-1-1.1 TaxID=3135230 RepID=UPI003412FF37
MASIKEIAKLADVSQGTASMVLGGKGDHYRISAVTQQKIVEAAKQLNYQPNISARRLRSGGETVLPIIALFWSLDVRTALINRFLHGLQRAFHSLDQEYELLIQPYVGNKLCEVNSLLTGTRYNGAIIANPTELDEQFLEDANLLVPIVLYQRSSDKYSSVKVDSFKTGQEVAQLFASRKHLKVGVLVPDVSSNAIQLRLQGFTDKVKELGLELSEQHALYADFSEKGGYDAIHRLLVRGEKLPTAMFAISDQMAVGALKALHESGRKVPDEMEIVGYDDDAITKFTIPALSTVHLPVEEMAEACVNLLSDLMLYRSHEPISKLFESCLILRSSCGGSE